MQDTPETPGGPDPATPPPPPPPPPAAPSHGGGRPGLIERVRNILIQPAAEWRRIDGEATTTGQLFTGYALILAAIPPVACLIGVLLLPFGSYILGSMAPYMLLIYAILLAIAFGLGLAIDALAPTFGGTKNSIQALKLAVYASTPMWLLGILFLLVLQMVMGGLFWLWLLASLGWGGYLLFLGIPILMRAPQDKAPAYAGAAVGAWIVLLLIAYVLLRVILGGMGMGMGRY